MILSSWMSYTNEGNCILGDPLYTCRATTVPMLLYTHRRGPLVYTHIRVYARDEIRPNKR